MTALLDTNVLVHLVNRSDPRHAAVQLFVDKLLAEAEELVVASQTLYEFWAVATRPVASNGLGYAPTGAAEAISRILATHALLPDPADLLSRWLALCLRYEVRGKTAHDARLVAWMNGIGIRRLVTLNTADFARFADIECLAPPAAPAS